MDREAWRAAVRGVAKTQTQLGNSAVPIVYLAVFLSICLSIHPSYLSIQPSVDRDGISSEWLAPMLMEAQTSQNVPPAGRSPLHAYLPGQERTESYCSVSHAAWTEPSTAQHPESMWFCGRHTSRDLHEGTRTISAPVGSLRHVRGPCLDSLFSPHPSQARCTRAPILWQPHLVQTSLIPVVCELGVQDG